MAIGNGWGSNRISMVGARPIDGPEVTHITDMRAAVESARSILHKVDAEMTAIEDDAGLTRQGKDERLREVAARHLPALERLEAVPSSVQRRLDTLAKKIDGHLDEARKGISPAMAQEIRGHVKSSGSAITEALRLKGELRAVVALVDAPPFLSGLSDSDAQVLRREALRHYPESEEQEHISRSLATVNGAVKSARAMIQERAGLADAMPQLKAV